MADTAIKPEIKVDPASTNSPSRMGDMEEYEDDPDLYIPAVSPSTTAWLVKIPPYLWQAWNEIYQTTADENPIEIGKMRVYNTLPTDKRKIQVRLTPGVPQHQGLPVNYDLDMQSEGYSNHAVFSEKDLPGHSNTYRPRAPRPLKPSGIPSKSDRYGNNSKNSVRPGAYRTAIPKQTALAPLIHHVADAHPVQDASYYTHFEKSYRNALRPKKTTTFQTGIDRNLHPGTAYSSFNSFGITSRPAGRKPPPKEKAVRISQEDLLDRLYQCFRRYKYWSLKALKNELKQPEAYIKQTLESIAVLIRSGDFAMNYKLKDEYAGIANVRPDEVKEETAAIKSEDEGSEPEDQEMEGDDGEDDLDEDFEDVKMEG